MCIVAWGDLDNVGPDNLQASKALHDLLDLLRVGRRPSIHRLYIERSIRTLVVIPPISGLIPSCVRNCQVKNLRVLTFRSYGNETVSMFIYLTTGQTYAGAIPGSITSISRVTGELLDEATNGNCADNSLYTGLSPTVSLIFFTTPRQPTSSRSSACEMTNPTS